MDSKCKWYSQKSRHKSANTITGSNYVSPSSVTRVMQNLYQEHLIWSNMAELHHLTASSAVDPQAFMYKLTGIILHIPGQDCFFEK